MMMLFICLMMTVSYVLFYILSNACNYVFCFIFKHKMAYDMRISDWSSDVCSSDLTIANMVFHPIKKLNHPRTSHPPRRAIFPACGKVSATSEPTPSCQDRKRVV